MTPIRLFRRLAPALLALIAACASGASRATGDSPDAASAARADRQRPLAALASASRVAVLPVRYVHVDSGMQWTEELRDAGRVGADLDDENRFALQERGVGGDWIWPEEVRRSAARSAGTLDDPARWNSVALLRAKGGEALNVPESLRAQFRAIGALTGARYVLYPVSLFVTRADLPDGTVAGAYAARASLRVALVDVRTGTMDWSGDVAVGPLAHWKGASAAVASRLADLIAPTK